MKNVRIIYTKKRPCGADPMALKNTIAVRAEIEGEKYGYYLELEDEETTVENVVQVLQVWFDELETLESKQIEGQWIKDEEGYVTCSNCGEEHTWDEFRPPYCDMCGAKMKG